MRAIATLGSIVFAALFPLTVSAEDMVIEAGDGRTLSGTATFGEIRVNGSLEIAPGASITVARLMCGTNSSGSAAVTIGANASVTVTGTEVNGLDCCLGYDSVCSVTMGSGASLTSKYIVMSYSGKAASTLALNNASCTANTTFYFCRNSGTATVDPAVWSAEVHLAGESSKLKAQQFIRNQRGSARILFEGGRMATAGSSGYDWLFSRQNIAGTRLRLQSLDGHDIILQIDHNVASCFRAENANATISLTGSNVVICGSAGGYAFSSDTSLGTVDLAYTGRLRVEAVMACAHAKAPLPVAAGIEVSPGAAFDLNGCAVATASLTAPFGAIVTNTASAAATLTLSSDEANSIMEEGVCGNIKIVKNGQASATLIPGGGIAALSVLGGAFRVQNRSVAGFSHYRFLPTARYGSEGTSVQYNEFVLYDAAGNDITSLRSGYEGSYVSGNSDPSLALDGNVKTKYYTYLPGNWLRIDYAHSVVAGSYSFATGDDYGPFHKYYGVTGRTEPADYNGAKDCRDVTGWRFQASSNTNYWMDLETVTGFAPEDTRNHLYLARAISYPNPACSLGRVMIASGATLSIQGQRYSATSIENQGTFDVATATLVTGGDSAQSMLYPAAGGGVEKTGPNVATLYLDRPLGGEVKVSGGVLRIVRGGARGPYHRFIFKKASGGTNYTLQLSELELYGPDGVKFPMRYAGDGLSVASLSAGFATMSNCNQSVDYPMANLFDGDVTTDVNITRKPNPDSDFTWTTIYMRTDGESPVSSYRLASSALANQGRLPVSWTLETSPDGVVWHGVDDRANENVALIYGSFKAYNSGRPYFIEALEQDRAFSAFEPSSVISISGGGVLDLSYTATAIGGISVDFAGGGGMVVGCSAAADGVLDVSSLPAGWQAGLPTGVKLVDAWDASAVTSWSVASGGRLMPSARVSVLNGELIVVPGGMRMIIR